MVLLNYKSLCELASLKETLNELLARCFFKYLEALLSLLKQRQEQLLLLHHPPSHEAQHSLSAH